MFWHLVFVPRNKKRIIHKVYTEFLREAFLPGRSPQTPEALYPSLWSSPHTVKSKQPGSWSVCYQNKEQMEMGLPAPKRFTSSLLHKAGKRKRWRNLNWFEEKSHFTELSLNILSKSFLDFFFWGGVPTPMLQPSLLRNLRLLQCNPELFLSSAVAFAPKQKRLLYR